MSRRLALGLVIGVAVATLCAQQVFAAADNAGNAAYSDGWQDGDNGGSGFGPWASGYSGELSAGEVALGGPKFIDNAPLAANSLGKPAFAVTTSNRYFFTDTSEVTRPFSSVLVPGQTFSIDVDGSALFEPGPFDTGYGNTVQLTSGSDERFGMFTFDSFNNGNWTSTGSVDTGIAAASSYHLSVKLVTADTFDAVVTPVGGGAPLFSQIGGTLSGTPGSTIDHIRITAYGTGPDSTGERELFFNNLSVTPNVPEPASICLLLLGGLGLLGMKTRCRK